MSDSARPVADDALAALVAAASSEAGVDARYLAGFPEAALHAATIQGRLESVAMAAATRAGREAAEDGVRVAALVDLFLSLAWRIAGAIRDSGGDREAVVDQLVALTRAADDAVEAACEGYEEAQRQAVRRQEARRREFIDALLSGSGEHERLMEMATGFGFTLPRDHLVVLARTDRALVDAGPVQGRLEREILARLGERDVVVATREGDLVFVFPGDLLDPVPGLLDLLDEAEPGPWRVATGSVRSGVEGVARSLRDAQETLDVGWRLQPERRIFRAEEWEAHRLLVRDREGLARMTRAVIEPLGAARGGAEPLVETLEAYFGEGGNITAMGRRLHLSARAVSYRLAAIERLTGLSPGDPADRFTLEAAVIGFRLLSSGSS